MQLSILAFGQLFKLCFPTHKLIRCSGIVVNSNVALAQIIRISLFCQSYQPLQLFFVVKKVLNLWELVQPYHVIDVPHFVA